MPTFPNRRPGDNIGGYVLGRHLGEGNSGQVFAVRDSDPDKKYAAKLLNKDALLAKNYPTRSIEKEILAMKEISGMGGNFVKLIECFQTDYEIVLIMTRADGGDVFEWRRYHRVPDYRVINNVVFQVAHGLAVLHKNGYIHRDIKHDNVLFLTRRQPSSVIIADFGLTTKYNIRRPYDSAQGFCGSLDYIPPEACRSMPYGPSFDMWSLGIFTMSFLTNRFPWDPSCHKDRTFRDYIGSLTEGWIDPYLDAVKLRSAKDFISKCLIVNPKKRMTAIEAVHHPFLKDVREAADFPVMSLKDGEIGGNSTFRSVVSALAEIGRSIITN
ncbi:uncharacterized protein H6S33_004202 [Morchella sextelata]|uniref:uncharacterized protein n=1 Tax=Morchella sextelata TaxID=1174677 RepID=UPI001D0502C0|nr:uncharacterized protein H6S33_004202 [Morchella sextelata]KAH0605745.1 hypothetical protein H6S33_004202 [Morchella sextelata]